MSRYFVMAATMLLRATLIAQDSKPVEQYEVDEDVLIAKRFLWSAWKGLESTQLSGSFDSSEIVSGGAESRSTYFQWCFDGEFGSPRIRCTRYTSKGAQILGSMLRTQSLEMTVEGTGREWSAVVSQAKPAERFPWQCSLVDYVRCVSGLLMSEAICVMPIVSALKSNGNLIVEFARIPDAHAIVKKRGMPIYGLLGWRCVFEQAEEGLRLLSVEEIASARNLVGYQDSRPVLSKVNQHIGDCAPFMGTIEAVVMRRVEFSDFVKMWGIGVPLCVTERTKGTLTRRAIDSASFRSVEDGAFSLSVPEEFGPAGVIRNFVTGSEEFVASTEMTGNQRIAEMIKRGAPYRKPEPLVSWPLIVGVVLGAVGVLVSLLGGVVGRFAAKRLAS